MRSGISGPKGDIFVEEKMKGISCPRCIERFMIEIIPIGKLPVGFRWSSGEFLWFKCKRCECEFAIKEVEGESR